MGFGIMNNNNEIEGMEVITEKPVELKKDEFFKILTETPEGLKLKIDGVGKTFLSKWANDKGVKPYVCFIDYLFTKDNVNYSIGISYNLGASRDSETFILTSGMNIFKILGIAIDLSKAEEIRVTKEFIDKTLTGVKFLGKIGAGYNGFIINPVKLLE